MGAQVQMKQISSILEEVNYNGPRPRLIKCIGAHNESGWIEYTLANNYYEFDEIRVVEGAVRGRPKSTPDGHSTDDTLEIIKKFPDPLNKIKLFTLDRPFKCLEEQKQIFLDTSKLGDWLFIVDCDEFYIEGDIARIRKAIELHPTASEFIPTFLHFYRDFRHVKAPHHEWQPQHQRIIKWQPGMRYHTHPVATDGRGLCTYFSSEYQPKRFTLPGIFIYHYGHAKGQDFHKMKQEFYRSELEKFKAHDGKSAADAFDVKFKEFVNYSEDLNTILQFDGAHPNVIKSHPIFEQRETILYR
jgi:glycosyltransferase involved in cell wall biosynthesis